MQIVFRFLFIPVLLLLASCSKYRYTTNVIEMPFTEIDTLSILTHQKVKKPKGVVLFVASYDSIYDSTKRQVIGPLTKRKFRVVEIQKFAYDDFIMRSGTDEMSFYLDNLANGFQYYQQLHLADTVLPLAVLGVNEGAVITPQLTMALRADAALAANPHFMRFELLLNDIIAQADNEPLQKRLFNEFYVRSPEELFAWLHLLEISEPSDRTLAGKSTKYWKSWFAYDPMQFWPMLTQPVFLLKFDNYLFDTAANGDAQRNVGKKVHLQTTQAIGDGFHRKDYDEIERWLLKVNLFEKKN
ncbi:MAG: hypothetical protein LAT76_09360 [Schleiferiaceae bacterium]|nr:hypothetical protein [Schleiferiaceae bacterium]